MLKKAQDLLILEYQNVVEALGYYSTRNNETLASIFSHQFEILEKVFNILEIDTSDIYCKAITKGRNAAEIINNS